jgi:MYND finger
MSMAVSIHAWHESKYGCMLRFANSNTFAQIREMWEFYSLQPSNGQAFKHQQNELQAGLHRAKELRKKLVGDGKETRVLSGLRSTAPCSMGALADLPRMHQQYWQNGLSTETLGSRQYTNPMFGALSRKTILHYGTDPILGYHLATAYAPLTQDCPLKPPVTGISGIQKLLGAAQRQFRNWAESFRAVKARITIRLVCADALAFCHVLQNLYDNEESRTAHWYCDNWHYEPLILDAADYDCRSTAFNAPLQFDVIDTSNLVDHLGCLNLLAATSPLLAQTASSTISTEMLVQRQDNIEQHKQELLGGNIATVSLLFGLCPIQYWTKISAASSFEDQLLQTISKESSLRGGLGSQFRCVVTWKSAYFDDTPSPGASQQLRAFPLSFDAHELAELVFRVYLEMFQDENWASRFSQLTKGPARKPYETYTRASLTAILRLIQISGQVSWKTFMEHFGGLVVRDRSLNMGAHYAQELYLHLHMLGLFTSEAFSPSLAGLASNLEKSPLRAWKSIPPVLCVTMVVPNQRLGVFRDTLSGPLGDLSPVCHLMMQKDMSQNIFPDVQLGFGQVQPSGERNTDSFSVKVQDDGAGWDGKAPLVVSAMVPTWVVLQDASLSTEAVFALKSTPGALMTYSKHLGMLLEVYKAALAEESIFITRHRPNMTGPMSVCGGARRALEKGNVSSRESMGSEQQSIDHQTKVAFSASINSKTSLLSWLTTHVDILAEEVRESLLRGAKVEIEQLAPFAITIRIGSQAFGPFRLPVPIAMTGGKTRIARKSSYVEFVAAISSPEILSTRPECHHPLEIDNGQPVLRNLHYVSLDYLAQLDLQDAGKLSWLTPHLSSMFSAQERRDRDSNMSGNSNIHYSRLDFKDSLCSIFMRFAGVQSPKRYAMFGIDNRGGGGVHFLIFASSMLLDSSNQSVVLDAAVLPLRNELVPKLVPLITQVQNRGLISVVVDDDELLLWKYVLPALTERCRDWTHNVSCEYRQGNRRIPVSVTFGERVLCSCGEGKFPSDYQIDGQEKALWNQVSRYATRIAIPACFPVPFMERAVDKSLPRAATGIAMDNAMERMDQAAQSLKLNPDQCAVCGKKTAVGGGGLMKCAACKKVAYCSKDCQTKDWKGGHKAICKELRDIG